MVEPRRYRIAVRGRLSERFASAFDGMSLQAGASGTVLEGEVKDQAHLYGILQCLRDLGIDLISLNEVPDQGRDPDKICNNSRLGGTGRSGSTRPPEEAPDADL
jgi:hypothetical protein